MDILPESIVIYKFFRGSRRPLRPAKRDRATPSRPRMGWLILTPLIHNPAFSSEPSSLYCKYLFYAILYSLNITDMEVNNTLIGRKS
jgi:hypothetical protein